MDVNLDQISHQYHLKSSELGLDLANAGYQPTEIIVTQVEDKSFLEHNECLIIEKEEKKIMKKF